MSSHLHFLLDFLLQLLGLGLNVAFLPKVVNLHTRTQRWSTPTHFIKYTTAPTSSLTYLHLIAPIKFRLPPFLTKIRGKTSIALLRVSMLSQQFLLYSCTVEPACPIKHSQNIGWLGSTSQRESEVA
jgi:hypothetical protein